MSKPKWWVEHVRVIEASLASLSEYELGDTNITIYDDGQGDERRRLYGSGSIAIHGVNIAVFANYVATRFADHLCVAALIGDEAFPVKDETLRRIEETIDLTVRDARRMLQTQLTGTFRQWMAEQRRGPQLPEPCDICGELTDKRATYDKRIRRCHGCNMEAIIFSEMKSLGWLDEDGRLTPEFRLARKLHFQSQGGVLTYGT
jgi:hypothetical protein